MKHIYLIEICKIDGSTPLGCCPMIEVEAEDRHLARNQVLIEYPEYEIVSSGRKDQIEDWKRQEREDKF